MKNIFFPLILILSLILVGCEKTIDESDLVERKDIHYQINSDKPFTGSVVSYHENGQVKTSGSYKKGLKEGLFEEFYDNGQILTSVNYFMSGKEGVENIYFENGNINFINNYKNNLFNGVKETYFENGQVELRENYESGEYKEKIIRYDENGNEVLVLIYDDELISKNSEVIEKKIIIDEEKYEYDWSYFRKSNNEPFTGRVIRFYPNGQLNHQCLVVNSEEEGYFEFYHENGKLMIEGNYRGGREEGVWKDYGEDGKISGVVCYQNGEEVDMSFCEEE